MKTGENQLCRLPADLMGAVSVVPESLSNMLPKVTVETLPPTGIEQIYVKSKHRLFE